MSRTTTARAIAGVTVVALGLALAGPAPAGADHGDPLPGNTQGDPLYGDLDGDGRTDRVTLGGVVDECTITVELGKKHGRFRHPRTTTYEPAGSPVAQCFDMGVVLDVGGDGVTELVLTWFVMPDGVDYTIAVLRDFVVVDTAVGQDQPSAIGLEDFDGDGLDDVYEYTDQSAGLVTLLNTPGDGLVPGPIHHRHSAFGPGGVNYEFADFDEDGATDVAFGFHAGAEPGGPEAGVAVILDDGTTTYLQSQSLDGGWHAEARDADGDGHVDVLTTNGDTGEVTVFLGHGDGTFTAA